MRADHVRQTRAALIAAGRSLFGRKGFAATSVEDVAAEARVTTGALYHHFRNKTELFAAVFEETHLEVLARNAKAAAAAKGEVASLLRAFDDFLDAILEPEVQRIVITDAPAVLGIARYTELDERYAFSAIVDALERAKVKGELVVRDPDTLARLLFGALSRGGMLVASSDDPRRTRNAVSRTIRDLLSGLARS